MTSCEQVIANSNAAFGTSGVRGLVEDLSDRTCFAYTLAFLIYLKQRHELIAGSAISVGHDLRPSSPRIATACMAAIAYAGLKPEFSGEIPTPALAYSAQCAGQPAIMITGSHIPFDRNGIKFYRADGELMKEDEAPIINCSAQFPEDLFANDRLDMVENSQTVSEHAAKLWLERYKVAFPDLLSGMRIGHYQHSAAGRDLVSRILMELGAEVVGLGRSDEFIPIDTEAVADSDKAQAMKWSEKYGLDALISTDGDGDRPLLADEKGVYFRGDLLGILSAIGLGATTVVTPVSTNTALEKSARFEDTARTQIGSPHVIKVMQEKAKQSEAIVVGFEPNGGFLTASKHASPTSGESMNFLLTRDALLPVLATIALSKHQGLPLSELSDLLPKRSTASDRLEKMPTARSKQFIAWLKATPPAAAELIDQGGQPQEYDETDGLRLTYENGDIVHLRPSGNAPELRVYVESDSDAAAASLLKYAKSNISEAIAAMPW